MNTKNATESLMRYWAPLALLLSVVYYGGQMSHRVDTVLQDVQSLDTTVKALSKDIRNVDNRLAAIEHRYAR